MAGGKSMVLLISRYYSRSKLGKNYKKSIHKNGLIIN
jgi:hypothetical protein